jgi:hypothetical protein
MNLLMNAPDVRGLIRSLCDGDRCPVDSRKFWTARHLCNLAVWADEKEGQESADLSCFIEAAVGEYQVAGLGK